MANICELICDDRFEKIVNKTKDNQIFVGLRIGKAVLQIENGSFSFNEYLYDFEDTFVEEKDSILDHLEMKLEKKIEIKRRLEEYDCKR